MFTRSLSSLALVFACLASSSLAGPLSPHAGPVAPTHKTLSEVEPRIPINDTNTPTSATGRFVISQPGSYYLTGNLTGVSGKHAIEITTSNVTLDLCGFTLTGVAGSKRGISYGSGLNNIAIVNGTVSSWGEGGVGSNGTGIGGRIERIHALNNTGDGIVANNSMSVSHCTAANNTDHDIRAFTSCIISFCTANANGGNGFIANTGSVFTNCIAYNNTNNGFSTSFSFVTFDRCTAASNAGNGISALSNTVITNCITSGNGLNGIRCTSTSLISGNICAGNGTDPATGAGILVTGTDNRIEGNNCTSNDRGIDIDSAGNIVLRNSCSGNALNWDIVVNNVVGPIIDRTAPASAAISGNSAPDSTGSTHPNANFSY